MKAIFREYPVELTSETLRIGDTCYRLIDLAHVTLHEPTTVKSVAIVLLWLGIGLGITAAVIFPGAFCVSLILGVPLGIIYLTVPHPEYDLIVELWDGSSRKHRVMLERAINLSIYLRSVLGKRYTKGLKPPPPQTRRMVDAQDVKDILDWM